jgi:fructosamine-3-kinase
MKLPVLVRQALNQAGLQGDWTLTPVGGGDTARSGLLEGGVSRYFVKQHRNPLLLEAEARGLEALAARLSVPRVVHCYSASEGGVLILEYLPIASLTGSRQWIAAGASLGRLHRVEGPARYGSHPDNFIGASLQSNADHSDWVAFFANERLTPQLQRARERGLPAQAAERTGQVIEQLDRWLPSRPPCALVHGDLWQGNLGQVNGEPVFYDPACYHGDPQVDLAMLNLFGGVPAAFYQGYQTEYPTTLRYQAWPVYDLYHWLNHYNLFGGQYARAVDDTARRLLTTR